MSDSAAALRRIVDILEDACGRTGWLSLDTLLSSTRHQHLSPDQPLSLAVMAERPDRVGAMMQSFRIARAMRTAGLAAQVRGDGRCTVVAEPGGVRRTISVQVCWQVDDKVVFAPGLPARAGVDAVTPVARRTVDGVVLPVPADPARVLTAVYGDSWPTLQPPYRLRPRALAAAADQARGYGRNRQRWDRFYRGLYGPTAPREPSAFGRWAVEQERADASDGPALVVDVGCGNGRDTRHFADHGHPVLGLDYSPAALACARDLLGERSEERRLRAADLNDVRAPLLLGAELAARETSVVLYARFVAHAVDDHAREGLWRLGALTLRRGGRMYLEFRTERDRATAHVFEDQHDRRYLDPQEVAVELKRHGGVVVHREEGRGLAPFGPEDPHICRMVVQWAR
ncbi:MAG: class I SAM-dependent methyltransferase [Actinomycetota bacterium]|nr:class I SAM-dependent methyltransferase [Actinomycetota bacterium]